MTRTIGIDLGLGGALAVLDSAGQLESAVRMPRIGSEFSPAALAALFKQWPMATAVCEAAAHVRIPARRDAKGRETPSTINAKSSTVLYECQGMVKQACADYGLRLVSVPAKTWQAVLLGVATGTGTTKERAALVAERLWPASPPPKWAVDAALIAEYGRRLVRT